MGREPKSAKTFIPILVTLEFYLIYVKPYIVEKFEYSDQ